MGTTINGMPLEEYLKKLRNEGEVIDNISAMVINNEYRNGRNVQIIYHGNVTITRKGKKYQFSGDKIEHINGEWYVDGKKFDFDKEQTASEQCIIKIEIQGDAQRIETVSGDVTVHGNVNTIKTSSGDVQCQDAVNINTMNGDVTCKGRPHMVNTMSGDINM